MKKALVILTALLTVVTLFTGCSSIEKIQPATTLTPQKADYKILGEITGQAEIRVFLLLFALDGKNDVGTLNYGTPEVAELFQSPFALSLNRAKSNAMYDAIGKLQNADKLIHPKFEIKSSGIPLLLTTYTVTVKAKGIQYTGPSQAR